MKKRMAVLLVLCMVLFSSCGIALTKDGQVAIYSTLDIEKTGYYTTGKDLLSRDMQKNYDKLEKLIYKLQPEMSVKNMNRQEIEQLIKYFCADNPQVFWLNSNYSLEHNVVTRDITSVNLGYYYTDMETGEDVVYTNEQVETMNTEMENAAGRILSGLNSNASEYEKAQYLHDYLASTVSYDETGSFQHNAYGALVDQRAVCDGLASAYMYLLQQVGMESRIVYGVSEEGISHAWNVVRIDGEYCHIDITWDMPPQDTSTILYTNFGLTDEQADANRTIFTPFEDDAASKNSVYVPIPHSITEEYDYYRYYNLYFTSVDDKELDRLFDTLNSAVEQKQPEVQIQFAEHEDFLQFVEDVSSGINPSFYQFPYSNSQRETTISTIDEENLVIFQFVYTAS